ncbi:MAG: hypothetical protein ACRCW2_04825 [Cellulosilyticaceae bacterium]
MSCRILTVFLILSVGMNGLGIIVWRKGNPSTVEAAQLQAPEGEISFTEESLQQYVQSYYSKQLQKILTPEELNFITQRQWEYILSVNGQEFSGNTIYLEGAQNVRIMIAEVAKGESLLPEDLLIQGRMWQSDETIEMTDYITIYAPISYEITTEQQGKSIKYYYEFKDVPPGTIITVQMGHLLKEKLRTKERIQGNRVEVIVR